MRQRNAIAAVCQEGSLAWIGCAELASRIPAPAPARRLRVAPVVEALIDIRKEPARVSGLIRFDLVGGDVNGSIDLKALSYP
ncbi:MAG: hypothetical protein K8U57_06885 [Planctomycetes bacterium]|nr:hypothetical protein [Planctomycetota bacterium]